MMRQMPTGGVVMWSSSGLVKQSAGFEFDSTYLTSTFRPWRPWPRRPESCCGRHCEDVTNCPRKPIVVVNRRNCTKATRPQDEELDCAPQLRLRDHVVFARKNPLPGFDAQNGHIAVLMGLGMLHVSGRINARYMSKWQIRNPIERSWGCLVNAGYEFAAW